MQVTPLKKQGFTRKDFESLEPYCRYNLSLGQECFRDRSIFHDRFIKLPRLDLVVRNKEYSFLHKLKAPKNHSYIYFVYNKKTGAVKLGRSNRVWNRILNHINAFISYGGSSLNDLGCIFSREAFADSCEIESKFISYYADKFPSAIKIKKEFFATENSRDTIKAVLKFFNDYE
jgi:hypothetical protein